jgi:isocitrate/isopropylmalate dehydrogenase
VLVVRELTGGLYFGDKQHGDDSASDTCVYSREEIERVAHVAFLAARRRRCRVHLGRQGQRAATSRLWRKTVEDVGETLSRRDARSSLRRCGRDGARARARRLST